VVLSWDMGGMISLTREKGENPRWRIGWANVALQRSNSWPPFL